MANPEWEPIVFAMEKGDVRGPVTGPQGFHVFQVTEVKRSDLKPFPDMKEQLQRELRRREMDKQTTTWVEELRKRRTSTSSCSSGAGRPGIQVQGRRRIRSIL
jgi:parvulin-like peptidyl-prolyl isomerase